MILLDQPLIRPALVLAGSALSLITGLVLIMGHPTPAVLRPEAVTSEPVSPGSVGPSRPDPGTTAGPARPTRVPKTEPRRAPASIAPPNKEDPRPERVRISVLGATLPIRPVGVAEDGSMELPDDPAELGWYRFGPAPGADRGSAVLAGHVDSREHGIGPLAGLDRAEAGDTITVITTTGPIEYTVDRLRYERRARLPIKDLFDRTGAPRLVIITCGGPYTPGQGYRDNLIVTATQVPTGK